MKNTNLISGRLSCKKCSKVNLLIIVIFTCILNTSMYSCQKERVDQATTEKREGLKLRIKALGLADSIINISKQGSLSKTASGNPKEVILARDQLAIGDGFDAIVSGDLKIKSQIPSALASSDGKISSGGIRKLAIKPLADNIVYRILIYNETGNELLQNVVARNGIDPEIPVEGSKTYKWVAVSTNTQEVPDLTGQKITSADLINKDLLYASGNITITGENNFLEITFEHKTTQIDVNIDTRGLFGSINTFNSVQVGEFGSTFKTLLNSADFDLLTGEFGELQPIPSDRTIDHLKDKSPETDDLVKTVTLFTVVPKGKEIQANSLAISPIFSINLDRHIYYPPSTAQVYTRNYGRNNIYLRINNSAFTTLLGDQFSLSANMIESPLIIGGISWARSNLWYDGSAGQKYPYRFKVDCGIPPYETSIQNEYWNWKSLTPSGSAGAGDPCLEVYPKGIWRMPTSIEMYNLGNRASYEYYGFSVTQGYQSADTYDWYAVVNQSWNENNNSRIIAGDYSGYSDKVIFSYNGYRQNGVISNSRTLIDSRKTRSFSAIVSAGYWTGTENGSSAVSLVANCRVDYTRPNRYTTTYDNKSLTNYSKTMGFNVRCIRNR
ncbi:fimbrillin family protein [Sphingobacterium siyangense]|nr:fimbrillin family protein [Sphingobacterium siyangense]